MKITRKSKLLSADFPRILTEILGLKAMIIFSSPSSLQSKPLFSYNVPSYCPRLKHSFFSRKQISCCHPSKPSCSLEQNSEQNDSKVLTEEKTLRRMMLVMFVTSSSFPTLYSYGKTKTKNPYDERRLLEQNKRIQRENNAPDDFPSFIREGFEVKVVASDNYIKRDSGLIYRDFEVGKGDCPKDGQQIIFQYIGYNESGRRIDSTYLQGAPAKIRMGTKALVPGFEEGIRDMKPGGKRRIIIPPELGPPVGPSTFFSAKQFEVFDVELLSIKDCQRRTIGFYSDVVCD